MITWQTYTRMRIFIIVMLFYISCQPSLNNARLLVEERHVLDSIPSGSAIVLHKGFAHIISDDGTYIFKLSLSNREYTAIPIQGMDTSQYRINKMAKRDYEAACRISMDNRVLLAVFGSGSISPTRDSLLLVDLTNPGWQKKIPLTSLYNRLKGKDTVINIEGAAGNENGIYLLNREKNNIFLINMDAFQEFIRSDGKNIPENITEYKLQPSGSAMTRISGAGFLDNHNLLITASMEDTPDAIQDGKIHGSFISLVAVDKLGQPLSLLPVVSHDGVVLTDKIESAEIAGKNADGSYTIWAIADNDEGNSVLFRLKLFVH